MPPRVASATKQTIRRERDARIAELILAGATYNQAAATLGIAKSTAIQAVRRIFAYHEAPIVNELREREAQRLDRLQMAHWSKAVQGDPVATGMVLRIMERRARMYGLDKLDELHERELRVAEAQAEMLATVLDAVISDLGHDAHDPDVRATVFRHLSRINRKVIEGEVDSEQTGSDEGAAGTGSGAA
jgi:DNA-binding CsgD family transcriptional regulator